MNDSTPAETSSFFHKAATYSVIALVASFVLQFLLSGISRNLPPDSARFLLYIPTVVVVSAIPAGIIALCGIPKYGFKKLLWKGLVGTIIPVVLFIMSVIVISELRKLSEDQALQSQTSE